MHIHWNSSVCKKSRDTILNTDVDHKMPLNKFVDFDDLQICTNLSYSVISGIHTLFWGTIMCSSCREPVLFHTNRQSIQFCTQNKGQDFSVIRRQHFYIDGKFDTTNCLFPTEKYLSIIIRSGLRFCHFISSSISYVV